MGIAKLGCRGYTEITRRFFCHPYLGHTYKRSAWPVGGVHIPGGAPPALRALLKKFLRLPVLPIQTRELWNLFGT